MNGLLTGEVNDDFKIKQRNRNIEFLTKHVLKPQKPPLLKSQNQLSLPSVNKNFGKDMNFVRSLTPTQRQLFEPKIEQNWMTDQKKKLNYRQELDKQVQERHNLTISSSQPIINNLQPQSLFSKKPQKVEKTTVSGLIPEDDRQKKNSKCYIIF
jgi:hypothetical protein